MNIATGTHSGDDFFDLGVGGVYRDGFGGGPPGFFFALFLPDDFAGVLFAITRRTLVKPAATFGAWAPAWS